MRKETLFSFSAMLLLATIIGCKSSESNDKRAESVSVDSFKTSAIPVKPGLVVGGATMSSSKNIIENTSASNDHTTFVLAIRRVGLSETLSSEGPFTIFAPTNKAFDQIPKSTLDRLMNLEGKTELTNLLVYHVVNGIVNAADLKDGQQLKTMQGGLLKVSLKGDKVMIDSAEITTSNIVSQNGVIHVVNQVLTPN